MAGKQQLVKIITVELVILKICKVQVNRNEKVMAIIKFNKKKLNRLRRQYQRKKAKETCSWYGFNFKGRENKSSKTEKTKCISLFESELAKCRKLVNYC